MKKNLLYIDIYNTLKSRIMRSNNLYRLPSERSLAQEFDVSRVTIRHALSLLQKDQLIEKKPSIASVIPPSIFKHDIIYARSIKEDFQKINKEYIIDIISFEIVKTPEHLVHVFGDESYFICRTISSDEVPLIYDESYMPRALFPDMQKKDAMVKYDYIEKELGLPIKCVNQNFSGVLPNAHIRNILQISKEAIIYFELQAELDNGTIFEYVQQYYHPKYTFSLSSYRH